MILKSALYMYIYIYIYMNVHAYMSLLWTETHGFQLSCVCMCACMRILFELRIVGFTCTMCACVHICESSLNWDPWVSVELCVHTCMYASLLGTESRRFQMSGGGYLQGVSFYPTGVSCYRALWPISFFPTGVSFYRFLCVYPTSLAAVTHIRRRS